MTAEFNPEKFIERSSRYLIPLDIIKDCIIPFLDMKEYWMITARCLLYLLRNSHWYVQKLYKKDLNVYTNYIKYVKISKIEPYCQLTHEIHDYEILHSYEEIHGMQYQKQIACCHELVDCDRYDRDSTVYILVNHKKVRNDVFNIIINNFTYQELNDENKYDFWYYLKSKICDFTLLIQLYKHYHEDIEIDPVLKLFGEDLSKDEIRDLKILIDEYLEVQDIVFWWDPQGDMIYNCGCLASIAQNLSDGCKEAIIEEYDADLLSILYTNRELDTIRCLYTDICPKPSQLKD